MRFCIYVCAYVLTRVSNILLVYVASVSKYEVFASTKRLQTQEE